MSKKFKVIIQTCDMREVYIDADFVEVVDNLLQFGVFNSIEPNIVAMFKDWSYFIEISCNQV